MSTAQQPTTTRMNWTTSKYPTGRRYWASGEYTIETTGSTGIVIGHSAGGNERHAGRRSGGYQLLRGRQGLGSFPTLAAAKARADRDQADLA